MSPLSVRAAITTPREQQPALPIRRIQEAAAALFRVRRDAPTMRQAMRRSELQNRRMQLHPPVHGSNANAALHPQAAIQSHHNLRMVRPAAQGHFITRLQAHVPALQPFPQDGHS